MKIKDLNILGGPYRDGIVRWNETVIDFMPGVTSSCPKLGTEKNIKFHTERHWCFYSQWGRYLAKLKGD